VAEPNKQDAAFLQQFEPDVFWQKHGKKILTGLAAVVAVGLGVYYWQRQAAEREEAAAAQLATASDPTSLQRLAQEFAGKPIGAQALLRLAEMNMQQGRNKEAADAFQSFLSQFPGHPMTESAQLGLVVVQESAGDFQGAKAQYQQILLGHPSGYTAIAAKLGAARCAEALGLTKEALQAYEELRPVIRGSPWETEVNLRYMVLARSQPPTPAPVPASAPAQPGQSLVIPIGGATGAQP
jgi:TolA-binding protein